jgi:hypothetical protein
MANFTIQVQISSWYGRPYALELTLAIYSSYGILDALGLTLTIFPLYSIVDAIEGTSGYPLIASTN